MNNLTKSVAVSLTLAFSVFCFCYLHTQPTTDVTLTALSLTEAEKQETLDQDDQQVYFPDLHFVEKTAQLVSRVLRVF